MAKSAELQRLASLSDCVFAVAMTLLAFNVRVPEQGLDRAKLPGELTRMFGESYGLVLSFAITAMFWVGHVRLLRSLAQATSALIYLVLLQLFWIVLLPISTSLWIRIEAKETVMIMGADLTLIALCGLLMWVYSHRNKLFERSALTHPVVIEIIGPIFPLLILTTSLAITLWTPVLGDKLWWGAFATPFVIHFARSAWSAAKTPEKRSTLQSDQNNDD